MMVIFLLFIQKDAPKYQFSQNRNAAACETGQGKNLTVIHQGCEGKDNSYLHKDTPEVLLNEVNQEFTLERRI